MDILSLPFIFPKVSSPTSSENEMSLNLSHHYQNHHSSVYRITEYQTSFIPRFIGLRNIKQVSFPDLSDYGISNKVSFPGLSDYGISNKFHSPVYRITEYQTKFHSPVYWITEYQTRFIPRFIGLRNIKQVSFLGLSDYGGSLKFYFLNSVISQYVG